MLQVPWIVEFEVVRGETNRMHYVDLLAVRTAVVEWAVEMAMKKPLGRVKKAGGWLSAFP